MSLAKPKIKRVEMKYRLDRSLSNEVKAWARDHLGLDENCNSESADSYDINTLYLDTAALDLYHRTGKIGAAKHRIRRYGNEQTLWLETKRKKKMVVCKNRSAVFESDLAPRLAVSSSINADEQQAISSDWCGDWFMQRIVERRLQPAIRIYYRRFARTSTINGDNLRLTIDSQMQAAAADGWKVNSDAPKNFSGIDAGEILELKFHDRMPHLFKELLRTFPIPATGFSKYRTAIERQSNSLVCLNAQSQQKAVHSSAKKEHSTDA